MLLKFTNLLEFNSMNHGLELVDGIPYKAAKLRSIKRNFKHLMLGGNKRSYILKQTINF